MTIPGPLTKTMPHLPIRPALRGQSALRISLEFRVSTLFKGALSNPMREFDLYIGVSDSCSLGTNTVLNSRLCGGIFGLQSDSKIAAQSVCGRL